MATISGKRFQITDGASSPTNLFPYTVTEAVYGLSTVLANTQSAAVTAAATSAASLYVPLTGGKMTGDLTMGANAVVFNSNSSSTWANPKNSGLRILNSLVASIPGAPTTYATGISVSGYYGFQLANTDASNTFKIRGTSDGTSGSEKDWVTLYHSGNSNLNTVKWSCATLNVNRQESTGSVPSGVGLEIQGYSTYVAFKTYTSSAAISTSHLVLDNAGNVGIGTSSPQYKLDVAGAPDWTTRFSATNSIVYTAHNNGYGLYVGSKQNSSSYYLLALLYGQTTLGSGGNTALQVNADGNVGIGTASPAEKLHVNGNFRCARTSANNDWDVINLYNVGSWGAASGKVVSINVTDGQGTVGKFGVGYDGTGFFYVGAFYNGGYAATGKILVVRPAGATVTGSITSTGDQVISSDAALKKNWREVGYGIEEIANCTVGRFDWKDGHGTSVGSKAQDWLPLVPELVHGEEGNMTLAYGQIALVNSILLARHETEQDKEIARLKARVKELETRLNIS